MSMAITEAAVVFSCEGEHLVGVVCTSSQVQNDSDVGVVIIVGGPQYRAGSHRQFVQLARSLAAQGVPVLRFDTRGMGDSTGEQHNLEMIEADVGAAIDALQAAVPRVKRVALWGLCGGASAALLYWRLTQDPRLQGMVLVNPWVRSEQTLARTRVKHYYLRRLQERSFWVKLFSGQVAGKAVGELMGNLRVAAQSSKPPVNATAATAAAPTRMSVQELARDKVERTLELRMAQAWQHFAGPKLLVLSGNDYTAKEFLETANTDPLWRNNLAHASVQRLDMSDADHTFSNPAAQAAVEARTLSWLRSWAGAAQPAAANAR
jgi:uncharacterized protein